MYSIGGGGAKVAQGGGCWKQKYNLMSVFSIKRLVESWASVVHQCVFELI